MVQAIIERIVNQPTPCLECDTLNIRCNTYSVSTLHQVSLLAFPLSAGNFTEFSQAEFSQFKSEQHNSDENNIVGILYKLLGIDLCTFQHY